MLGSLPVQRGVITGVSMGKGLAFASTKDFPEVLLLASRQWEWKADAFSIIPPSKKILPAKDSAVIMEIETRDSGQFRALKWAALEMVSGTLKFFLETAGYGFVETELGEIFVGRNSFRRRIGDEFRRWPEGSAPQYPTEVGVKITLKISAKPSEPGRRRHASEWAVS